MRAGGLMGPARSQWRVHCRPLSQAVSLYKLLYALAWEKRTHPMPCALPEKRYMTQHSYGRHRRHIVAGYLASLGG